MKESQHKLTALIDVLKGHEVVIQAHNYPDPDAIATAFGLQHLLGLYDIDAKCVYCGKIDKLSTQLMIKELHIDMKSADVYTPNEDDYLITVDGQRDNSNFTDLPGIEVACIDHHPWTTSYKYRFVDHRSYGACATIIADYYFDNDIDIPMDVATALLYAIKVDTRNFCRHVTEEDIRAFAKLNSIADNKLMTRLGSNELELTDLRAYGAAIQSIVVYDVIGFVHIPFDCPDGLVAMVSDFILSLDSVDLAIVYANRDGGFKFSVRSEMDDVPAGELTKMALEGIGDGGGHAEMAGGVIPPGFAGQSGHNIDAPIRDRFMKAYKKLHKC